MRHGHGDDDDDDDYDDDEDCELVERSDLSILGLAKSIDAEYKNEEDKLGLNFFEVLQRERERPVDQISKKSRDMTPLQRTQRRMSYAKGNIENKYVMMTTRQYGSADLLDKDHLNEPPTLDDLNQTPGTFAETYWSKGIFRASVVVAGYLTFPLWCKIFINFQTGDPEDFSVVVGQIAPNIGVLYATLLSLTLSVLYQRFTRIQENVSTEAMLLSQITRNLLSLFADEPEWAQESLQIVANQVRIMLSRTRGLELLSIMKADTYANLLAVVDDYHYLNGCNDDFSARQESICGMLRGELQQITETRALRLSDEASSLPPTHFLLITSLSFVSIVAYVTASLEVVEDLNNPPEEASLLFSGLLALYILFFNFCKDLNGPFAGVYQIKRSNAASHLLQTKWLIVSQLGDKVSFGVNYDEEPQPNEEEEEVDESLVDKMKGFFSGSTEVVDTVEANAMQILDTELQTPIEPLPPDVLDELCEAAPPGLKSLNCDPAAPEYRLLQLQDELARLKWLNEQLNADVDISQVGKDSEALSQVVESKVKPITEQSTGITFDAKLDDELDLYLVGAGVRKKAMINLYGVAMYSSPSMMEMLSPHQRENPEARKALLDAARTFDSSSHTSFVVEMAFKADAKTISQAIAKSVARRYSGPEADVAVLEELIFDGVQSKGGQATKGMKFRFDCSQEGVSVCVDGDDQGEVLCEGLGAAFVDVFMDEKAVSPQLVNNCLDTWCGSGIQEEKDNIIAKLSQTEKKKAALAIPKESTPEPEPESNAKQIQAEKNALVESKALPLKEKATGVSFNAKIDDGLYLVGCGVRKKAIINVYAVAMYSSPAALEALAPFPNGKQKKEAQVALRNAARTFGPSSPTTSFVLEMTFKADGKAIAEAIADGVKPRQGGSGSDVKELENLIVQGVAAKGGQATKGTIFRFDCSEEGVSVSVDGNAQGSVISAGIGSALVDVFMDDKAVSPQLVDSCLDTWCGKDLFVAV